jgi:group I intron endonuclease
MKSPGIYKIQSKKKPERIYIGSTQNIHLRWGVHLAELRKGIHINNKLQYHFNKYGEADLVFSLITGCDKNDLLALEQFYLDAFNPWFNICPTAGNTAGRPVSDETRKKIAKIHKGKSPWNKGKTLTEEHKRRIGARQQGENNSMYGKPSPRRGGKGYPNPNKGKKGIYSEETLSKMRISNKRAWELRKQKEREEQSCH